jgi:hypothetical protein
MTIETIARMIELHLDDIHDDNEYAVAAALTDDADLIEAIGVGLAMRRHLIEAGEIQAVAIDIHAIVERIEDDGW